MAMALLVAISGGTLFTVLMTSAAKKAGLIGNPGQQQTSEKAQEREFQQKLKDMEKM